jgi:hypothetical protein
MFSPLSVVPAYEQSTMIIPHFAVFVKTLGAHAPTHRLHPPLLPILYPHLKKAGAPPVEALLQHAQQEVHQRMRVYLSRLLLCALFGAPFGAGATHTGEGRAHPFQDARARLACE